MLRRLEQLPSLCGCLFKAIRICIYFGLVLYMQLLLYTYCCYASVIALGSCASSLSGPYDPSHTATRGCAVSNSFTTRLTTTDTNVTRYMLQFS